MVFYLEAPLGMPEGTSTTHEAVRGRIQIYAKLYSQIALPWFQQPDFRKAALVALSQELDQRKAA